MRKSITSQAHRFIWTPQTPITGTPSLSIASPIAVSSSFTRFTDDLTITAIASDRRTLTLSSAPANYYREQQAGFVLTARDTHYSVRVVRLGGTQALLAEPLPREIDLTTNATLHLPTGYVDIGAGVLTTSGYYTWQVDYTQLYMSQPYKDKGLIKVTPRPFDTGLTHTELVALFANLADMIPRRQADFEQQIQAAEDELILAIRAHLNSDDITEDEVFNPESFKLAHAYCTAAIIYEQVLQFDNAEAMRARCADLLDRALQSIALDLDGDGIIDEGEESLQRAGGSPRDFRASWKSYTKKDNDLTFIPARGMRH
tara:strand:+ start:12330 stop:13274 length:945 start_codon:yes stop_codon:yes gene_type:complete